MGSRHRTVPDRDMTALAIRLSDYGSATTGMMSTSMCATI